MTIPFLSRSFVAKVALAVLASLVVVLLPLGTYQLQTERQRATQDLYQQISTVAEAISMSLTNQLLSENQLEMELTIAQLQRKTFFTFLGVADRNGRWISHSDETQRGQTLPNAWLNLGAGLHDLHSAYLYTHPLTFSGKTVGLLFLGIPHSYVDAPVQRRLDATLMFGATAGSIVVVVLVLVLTLQLRPIGHIRALAKKLAQGHFGLKIGTRRKDEIGQLIASLNDTSVELERAQQEKLQHQLLDQEVLLAAEIQNALIPEHVVRPAFLVLDTFFEPAKSVGGDFYYCANGKKGDYYMLVADVSGKGVASALLGSQIQGMFAPLIRLSPNPRAAFVHVNAVLREQAGTELYCTAVMAHIKPDRSVTLVNAGHPGIRLVDPTGNVTVFDTESAALGILDTTEFETSLWSKDLQLLPGQKLVLLIGPIIAKAIHRNCAMTKVKSSDCGACPANSRTAASKRSRVWAGSRSWVSFRTVSSRASPKSSPWVFMASVNPLLNTLGLFKSFTHLSVFWIEFESIAPSGYGFVNTFETKRV